MLACSKEILRVCVILFLRDEIIVYELTPLFFLSFRKVDQIALQQQIEALHQQQIQLQAQYSMLGQIPPSGSYNPLQPMGNINPQGNFQFPQQQNVNMGAQSQQMSHRRNQSAFPNMGTGPPPAPSAGASGSSFGNNEGSAPQGRENTGPRGGRGGGPGHQRRHSLALADAKKAAELAQQKRTQSSFQFPAQGSADKADDDSKPAATHQNTDNQIAQGTTTTARGGRGSTHGRSQSMAVGNNGRGRGGFGGEQGDFSRRPGGQGHARTGSRNFEGNWRAQGDQNQMQHIQQPGHRARTSMSTQGMAPMGTFQYPTQGLVQLPGQMALPLQMYPSGQLNQMQMVQLQALQAQMNASQNGVSGGLQNSQHNPQMQQQQQQQPQRKTLFTPYLPQASLPALLGQGALVCGTLRVNKKNRSDAYVTATNELLDADIFICGSKDRNRALEGDLVAVELLDVDEVWAQKKEKEEKKKRKDITDTRSGSTGGNNQGGGGIDDSNAADGGIRRRGSLRQRPTQKKNDDVEVEGQSLLLVEEEEISDEQKPLYAGHIVAVIERVAGQMFSGTLGLLRPSSQATKEKQEAERAARDGGNSRQQESRQQDKPKIVWFKPTDKRVPLIAIPTEQAPKDFVEKHQAYADRIFVACIKRWPITSLHPFGTLVECLGRMGDMNVETNALLRDNNFGNDDFSDAVLRSIGHKDWSLDKEDTDKLKARRDFREEVIFTIDVDGSEELGHAIHMKKLDEKFEIAIHIPDVAHFVKANTLVDREAKKRGTAVHLVNRTCRLFPPSISEEVCAFVPNQERLSVSVVFKVNPENGYVAEEDVWIGKGIVKSTTKISLADIDKALEDGEFGNNVVSSETLVSLERITEQFRVARLGATEAVAPLRLFQQLDDENIPVQHNVFDVSRATQMLEELVIKTNQYVAQRLVQGLPEKALLRRQASPNDRRMRTISDRMRRLGYEIEDQTSGKIQDSLFRVSDPDMRKGMETLYLKTMQRAKYGIAHKLAPHHKPHFIFNVPFYTHFTSPTRRYADVVVHRQMDAILSAVDDNVVYDEDSEALVKLAEACNNKKDSAQNAQEQSIHIEACRTMDKKRQELNSDLIAEGIVICVYESAFDVLIPEWGFEKRVHCDQLPLKKAEFRSDKRILELYWEKGVPSSAYVPEDERPKAAASQRMTNALAAARQAEEAERVKKEREEAIRKQTETGTVNTEDVNALFDDDDDNASDITDAMAGVSLAERPTQSVPGSPMRSPANTHGVLHRTRSDSKVPHPEAVETRLTNKEKYLDFFKLREEGGDYIQDVTEMTRVPVILKTDLSKSPP